ncbi:MAG: aminoacyl-tRNA hydrolase [Nitrospirae bacterium RBG_16_64_22]|nr:MAG: aminoacyl-tRNA hydrolase [Nitrospirae bacterium RBG_16_64_22]
MRVVVGLGNPGARYEETRHNVGFRVVERMARELAVLFRPDRSGALTAGASRGPGGSHGTAGPLLLVKPQGFMNLSGEEVGRLLRYHRLEAGVLIVVHDDLDLEPGRIQIKNGGGHGGHNGLRSIIDHLGMGAFARVRVGIGRPPRNGEDAAEYVLSPFTKTERPLIEEAIDKAAEAAAMLAEGRTAEAMNRFNVRLRLSEPEKAN